MVSSHLKIIAHIMIVSEMLKKIITYPLPLMSKPTPTQIQTAEASTSQFKEEEEEEDIVQPSVDQIYCWWMEMPEMKKVAICIRKTPNVKFAVRFVNEFQVEIQSDVFLMDEEIQQIG